ncbi:MAG: tyrosine-type recombinase/integrase [Halobacteria archaeon]
MSIKKRSDSLEKIDEADENFEDWFIITEKSKSILNKRQEVMEIKDRKRFIKWYKNNPNLNIKKNTFVNYLRRLDKIKRLFWKKDGYRKLSPEDADEYLKMLKLDKIRKSTGEEYSGSTKRRNINALQIYFRYKNEDWTPEFKFQEGSTFSRDSFTENERRKLKNASLDYNTLPNYGDVTPEERKKFKKLLSYRLDKPVEQISPEDWKRQNKSFKIPSLIHVALDIGARPSLINRMKTDWVRSNKKTIYIPKNCAPKNNQAWEPSITTETANTLERWLRERKAREKYKNNEHLWLNREGNTYSSKSLCKLLRDLCQEAGIPTNNRKITWYSIRHSLGDLMTKKGGIEQARQQLRHKRIESTLHYTKPSIEERRTTLRKLD